MKYLLMILGVLLLLFGGGCTLIVGAIAIDDPSALWNDAGTILGIWLPLGLLPLAIGVLLFRWGSGKTGRRDQNGPRDSSGEDPKET